MHSGNRQQLPDTYYLGRRARQHNEANNPPAGLSWKHRHWFMAGWNDRDMELQKCA